MDITRDIQSLSEFKQNASKFVKQVQETREPVVLTVNGKAAVVIQDAESYQEMAKANEYWQTVSILRKRLADAENFENWPTADEVFDRLFTKYGIDRDEK